MPTTDKVGFGIIGAGMIARFHAQALASLDNAYLVGVYDKDANAAQRFGAEFNCRVYPDFAAFLAAPEIRAVTIATPSGFHRDVALPAAEAGKHILCEKPLEISLPRVDEIIHACEQHHVLLSPVFQARFTRPVQLVRDARRDGRFGRMVLASAQMRWYRDGKYYHSSSWRGTWALDGGGALMNQAIHTVDMLLYINGDVEEVFAYAGTLTHDLEVEDNLCAALRYRNGSFGTLEVSTSCAPGFPRRLEFSGSGGTVAFEEDHITRWEFHDPLPEDQAIQHELGGLSSKGGGTNAANINAEGHSRQIADLADAIRNGRKPALDGREGRRAIELIEGIYTSVRTGKPFRFSTPQPA